LSVGLVGRAEGSLRPGRAEAGVTSVLASSAAAVLFEKAAIQAVAPVLPGGAQTLGSSLRLDLSRPPYVTIGSRLEAIATLVEVAPDGTLRFEVELREGERRVASGEHQRFVVEAGQAPAPPGTPALLP